VEHTLKAEARRAIDLRLQLDPIFTNDKTEQLLPKRTPDLMLMELPIPINEVMEHIAPVRTVDLTLTVEPMLIKLRMLAALPTLPKARTDKELASSTVPITERFNTLPQAVNPVTDRLDPSLVYVLMLIEEPIETQSNTDKLPPSLAKFLRLADEPRLT
jgi:hypothetical protein